MKHLLKTTGIVAISFLCGASLAAWAAFQMYDWMQGKEAHVQNCADVLTNIRIIERLQDHRIAEAIELLELQIDGGLIGLSAYSSEAMSAETQTMVTRTLQIAREHRQNNPRDIEDPATRAAVESILRR